MARLEADRTAVAVAHRPEAPGTEIMRLGPLEARHQLTAVRVVVVVFPPSAIQEAHQVEAAEAAE
jgi:hypothetical protein